MTVVTDEVVPGASAAGVGPRPRGLVQPRSDPAGKTPRDHLSSQSRRPRTDPFCVSRWLAAHRKVFDVRPWQRAATAFVQAVLVLRWFHDATDVAVLARDAPGQHRHRLPVPARADRWVMSPPIRCHLRPMVWEGVKGVRRRVIDPCGLHPGLRMCRSRAFLGRVRGRRAHSAQNGRGSARQLHDDPPTEALAVADRAM